MPWQVGDGGGLGLGKVVAFRVVGQGDLHDVEGADVGFVALGPGHPDAHDGAGGQVHDRRVLERRGEDEEVQGGPAGGGDPVAASGRTTDQTRRVGRAGGASGLLLQLRLLSWLRLEQIGLGSRRDGGRLVGDVFVGGRFAHRFVPVSLLGDNRRVVLAVAASAVASSFMRRGPPVARPG